MGSTSSISSSIGATGEKGDKGESGGVEKERESSMSGGQCADNPLSKKEQTPKNQLCGGGSGRWTKKKSVLKVGIKSYNFMMKYG